MATSGELKARYDLENKLIEQRLQKDKHVTEPWAFDVWPPLSSMLGLLACEYLILNW